MSNLTATYSPQDNKLRLYAATRLPEETYKRVREAGFIWAPKQELFVAPAWCPSREDMLLDLCGCIGDEDKSLEQRAEDRAERFEAFSERRAEESKHATASVKAIADGIPLGQPILIGHHSQRRAERDAKKIQRGIERAVSLWETSAYWLQRAARAKAHASYKEAPAVRARRIKGIEAETRRWQRRQSDAKESLRMWQLPELTLEKAIHYTGRNIGNVSLPRKEGDREDFNQSPDAYTALSNGFPSLYAPRTLEEVRDRALIVYPREIAFCQRWIDHLANRIAYERAMLDEAGGTATDQTQPEVGGAIACLWSPNGGWAYIQKVNRVTLTIKHQWNAGGRIFLHKVDKTKIRKIMSKAEVDSARASGRLTDIAGIGFLLADEAPEASHPHVAPAKPPEEVEAMKATLAAGVTAVAAPQLFPTPIAIAFRMTDLAGVLAGRRVLEPSAGTGRLVEAARNAATGHDCFRIVAVERSVSLASHLRDVRSLSVHANPSNFAVVNADFLECSAEEPDSQQIHETDPDAETRLGKFDIVLMNPPFENGADIKHIKHALTFLKPGGRLVAICAAGPRQHEALQPLADHWEELGSGQFEGTSVNTVLLKITT